MTSLDVDFAGLKLKNPLVMASAPPTETVESIARCEDAGAAAAITKTTASYDARSLPRGGRRTYVDERGLWALSTFRRETLTIDAGARLVAGAVMRTDIPIIASVGGLDMNPASWIPACQALEQSGASAIQLDLFYMAQPRCAPNNVAQLRSLVRALAEVVQIPLLPKLNVDIPAHYAAAFMRDLPIRGLLAIDSVRVPPPIDFTSTFLSRICHVQGAGECSLFGAWQKPITLQYVRTLFQHQRLPILAGGGLTTGFDAAEAILFGATAVQFATAVIQRGFSWIAKILEQLEQFVERGGFDCIRSMQGAILREFAEREQDIYFADVKASVNADRCVMCGLCTQQTFCSDIVALNGRVQVMESCDGCGMCVSACPTTPKALSLVPSIELGRS